MRHVVIALGMALLAGASPGQTMPEDASGWIRVSAGNAEILTDAGRRRALKMAEAIQNLTEAVDQATLLETHSDHPTLVVAFRRPAEFRPYRDLVMGPGTDKTGVFLSRAQSDYILLDTTHHDMEPLLLHELTHQFVRNTFPEAPLWLNEGLAELFGTFEARGERVTFGVPDRDAIQVLRRTTLIPMDAILEMTGSAEEYRGGPRTKVVYAQSWAMVHYLLIGNEATRDRLGVYLDLLTSGESSVTAFSEAFGMSTDQMEKEIHRYINAPTMKHLSSRVRPEEQRTDTATRDVSLSELLSELGTLLLDTGRDGARHAEPFLREAIRLDGRNALAHAALGDLEMQRGARDAAIRSWETAREIDPDQRRAGPGARTGVTSGRMVVTTTSRVVSPEEVETDMRKLREKTLRELEEAKTPEERERLEKVVAATGHIVAARKAPELYEEAIRLANDQKVSEALELIERILSTTRPGTLYHTAALDLKHQIESQR